MQIDRIILRCSFLVLISLAWLQLTRVIPIANYLLRIGEQTHPLHLTLTIFCIGSVLSAYIGGEYGWRKIQRSRQSG